MSEREIVFTRETHVSPDRLYAGWTTPELLLQWFTPKPWQTTACEIDPKPGGTFHTMMRSPEGEEFPNPGVFLEAVPNERLVFTNAYFPGWEPNPGIFFTVILTFEAVPNGGTRYTARARHWTVEAREKHEAMGFVEGWGKAFEQLVELTERGW
jgi:uncharacterized protein YndB with AHSA1/START domain